MAFVGNPEFLNTKTYPAIRDRTVMSHMGVQKGVDQDGDFLVVASTGATPTVQVAAGDAMVQASHPTLVNQGLYHVNSDAAANVALANGNASNPRVDQIVLVVKDPSYDPTLVSSVPTLEVVAGTPTPGATLNNRSGAATTLPPNSLLLADVLVLANATSVTSLSIRDRRSWMRGLFKRVLYAPSGSSEASTATQTQVTDLTNWAARCEVTGDHPLEFSIQSSTKNNRTTAGGTWTRVGVGYNSVVDGTTPVYLDTLAQVGGIPAMLTTYQGFSFRQVWFPAGTAIGSTLFFPWYSAYETAVVGWTVYLAQMTPDPFVFTVRELLHGNTNSFPSS